MTVSKPSFVAAAFALCTSMTTAYASSLSDVTTTGPQLNGPFDMTNFFGFFGSGSVSGNTASTTVLDTLSTSNTSDIASDNSFSTGALSVTDGGAGWLTGSLADLAVTSDPAGDDSITMLFDSLGGTAAGEFGDFVVAELTGEFGAMPFALTAPMATFGVSGSATFTGAEAMAPIPLPAGLPLLIAALAGTAVIGRRKT